MKQTITKQHFIDTCRSWPDREQRFSYEGLDALYDYLENYEEETGTETEFDYIALCCDYTEYDSPQEAVAQYEEGGIGIGSKDINDYPNIDLVELAELECEAALEYLEERTTVIPVEGGGVIIQNF